MALRSLVTDQFTKDQRRVACSILEQLVESTAGAKTAIKSDLQYWIVGVSKQLHRSGYPISN